MQPEGGVSTADNSTSVELNVDINSKSATSLTLSRQRPVSVPVHTVAANQAFRKLVSHRTRSINFVQQPLMFPAVPIVHNSGELQLLLYLVKGCLV